MISFACACGQEFNVSDDYAGGQGRCQKCGKLVAIPKPLASLPMPPNATSSALRKIEVACPNCKQKFDVDLGGLEPKSSLRVVCDHCGVEKNLAAFQKELGRQIEFNVEQRKKEERQRADEVRKEKEEQRRTAPVPNPMPQTRAAAPHQHQTAAGVAVIAPVAVPFRTEQGHQVGVPVINIAPPRRSSSLGVASLVLGILAFLICWVPLINLLGVPLAALGLVLGAIGFLVALTRKGASIGYPIAGSAICGVALFVAISMTGALVGGLKKAGDEIMAQSERRNAKNQATVAPATASPRAQEPLTQAKATPPIAGPAEPQSSASSAPQDPATTESEWASAESAIQQREVQVHIKSVRVGQVALKNVIGDSESRSKDPLLIVQVGIQNVSETKKVDYLTWAGQSMSFGTRVGLTDNFGNRYKLVSFGFSSEVVGAVRSESIYPGRSISDVIVFEEPIGKVEFLNLELPAEQFGGTGMLRIRIPATMIKR